MVNKLFFTTALLAFFFLALSALVLDGAVHEWLGLLWCTLVLIHCFIHKFWFKTFFKGNYTIKRFFKNSIIFFLILCLTCLFISGMANSSHLLGFSNLEGSLLAQQIHSSSAYWLLILSGVHCGNYWVRITAYMKKTLPHKISLKFISFFHIFSLINAFFGIWASFDRGIGAKLFAGASFDFWDPAYPNILLYAEYVSIFSLYALTGYSFTYFLPKIRCIQKIKK